MLNPAVAVVLTSDPVAGSKVHRAARCQDDLRRLTVSFHDRRCPRAPIFLPCAISGTRAMPLSVQLGCGPRAARLRPSLLSPHPRRLGSEEQWWRSVLMAGEGAGARGSSHSGESRTSVSSPSSRCHDQIPQPIHTRAPLRRSTPWQCGFTVRGRAVRPRLQSTVASRVPSHCVCSPSALHGLRWCSSFRRDPVTSPAPLRRPLSFPWAPL